MFHRLWPAGLGTLTTTAVAGGFHATPFWNALLSVTVGATMSIIGMILQYKRRKSDRSFQETIRAKDETIQALQESVHEMHSWMEGIPMRTRNTDGTARPPGNDWTPEHPVE
jgi:hypothetical protein